MALKPNLTMPWVYLQGLNVSNWTPQTTGDTIQVYVNSSTGADTNPGTTTTSAFLTISRALEASSFQLSDGLTVQINLAGAADHEIPADYEFPLFSSSDSMKTQTSTYGFAKKGVLIIAATPTLEDSAVISSVANNANSGQIEVTCPALSFTSGAYDAGTYFAVDADNKVASIRSNTATVLKLSSAETSLATPIRVYSQGATIVSADPSQAMPTILIQGSQIPIIFYGCAIEATSGDAVQAGPGCQVLFIGCNISSLTTGQTFNTSLVGPASADLKACALSSLIAKSGKFFANNSNFMSCAFDASYQLAAEATACSFVTPRTPIFSGSTSATCPGSITGTNLFVSGSTDIANVFMSRGFLSLTTCDVAAAGAVGVLCQDSAFAILTTVTSSTVNTTFGLSATTNAKVQVSSGTILNGTTAQLAVQGLTSQSFANFRLGAGVYNASSVQSGASVYQTAAGALATKQRTVVTQTSATLTATTASDIIVCDTTSNTVTVTLPLASAMVGRTLTFFKTVAGNSMVIDGDGSETINGAATKTTATQFGTLTIFSDGTAWWIISTFGTIT